MKKNLLKSTFAIIFEFVVIFICFVSMYYPLSVFTPYKTMFSKLENDYVYTLNEDYSEIYQEVDNSDIALYHFDYSADGDECTVYMNEKGAEMGIHVFAESPFCAFYKFELNKTSELEEGKEYDLVNDNLVDNTIFKTKLGQVSLDADYLIIDNNIDINKCEYKIYPPNDSYGITDDISFSYASFSARGRTIKNSVYRTTNTLGIFLILSAIIPSTILLIAISFFYSMQIDNKSKQYFINHVFYRKKKTIINETFAFYFIRSQIFALVSALINYFIFIGNDLMLLFLPIVVFFVLEFLYLYIFTTKKINGLLKEGVDIKYVY